MRGKVFVLRLSIILTIFSFILMFLTYFCIESNKITDFINSIANGVFTGTIVSVCIYITEYSIEKRQAQENYYELSANFLSKIAKIRYLWIGEKEELDILYDYQKVKVHDNDDDDLYARAKKFYKINTVSKEVMHTFLGDKLNEYKDELDIILKQYLILSEFRYVDIENAYASIYYFRGQKYRNNIYNTIHKPQRDILYKISNMSFYINVYNESKDPNLFAIIDKINEFQNEIFDIVTKDDKYFVIKNVYSKHVERIDMELEKFRAKIYGCKPLDLEHEGYLIETNSISKKRYP